MAARRESGGGGIAGVLGVLFLVGLIVKYIWFIVGALAVAAVAAGVYYAGRAALRRSDEQRRLARDRANAHQILGDTPSRAMDCSGDDRGYDRTCHMPFSLTPC